MIDDKESLTQSFRLIVKLRESEQKAHELLQEKRYVELLALNQAMNFSLSQYYNCSHKQVSNARKDQLSLAYNRALFHLRHQNHEEAANLLLQAVSNITNVIDQEKSRLGFLDHQEVILTRQSLQLIEEAQLDLAVFYYYLGVVSAQSASKEVALASALKSICLIQQFYKSTNANNKTTFSEVKGREEIEIKELLTILNIRENLANSKQLQLIEVSSLQSVLSWILHKNNTIQYASYGQLCVFGQVATLKIDEIQNACPETRLMKIKKLQCLDLFLLSQIESIKGQGEQSQKSSQEKNILLPTIFAAYIYKQYLPPTSQISFFFSQFSILENKRSIQHPLRLTNLLSQLGLSSAHTYEKQPLRISCSDNLKVLESRQKERKTFKPNKKDKKTGSKQKKLSPRIKTMNSPPAHKIKQERKSEKIIFPINQPKTKTKQTCKAYSPTEYYLEGTNIENQTTFLRQTPSKQKKRDQIRSKSKKNKDKLKNTLKKR